MRLLKVPTSAAQATVTALSINDSGERLVTAGYDGAVRVWDIKALTAVATLETMEQEDLHKLQPLSTFAVHKGSHITALAVRGSDAISCAASGQVVKTDLESGTSSLLFKHTAEINDIAFLENVLLFATLSGVISYDLEKSKFLSEIPSRSEVRSLSVDPSKAYLVTVGFNRVVSLYQIELYNGDILYKKITVASQTLQSVNEHCKISWAPSGERLALPNVNLDPNSSAIGMVSRSNWRTDFSLIGQNSNVVRFSPVVYNDGQKNYNIVASSGIDKSIAVWNTSFQRPLFTAADVSHSHINDLWWTSDGLTLFAAAESILVFVFDKEELGTAVPSTVVQELISKLKVPEPLQLKLPPQTVTPSTGTSTSEISQMVTKTQDRDPRSTTPSESKDVIMTDAAEAPTNANALYGPIAPTTNINTQASPQIITQKNGKKRIAPTLLSTVNGKPTGGSSQLLPAPGIENKNSTMEFDAPSYSVPNDLKRKEDIDASSTLEQPAKKKREAEVVEFVGSVAINPATSFSKVRISTPKIRSSFIFDSPDDDSLSLEIKNGNGTEQKPTRITLLKSGTRQVFADFIPKLAGLAAGGEGFFWAVSTVDGILYIYSDSGRRLFPPIILGTPLSFLESKGKYLLAVTSVGEVHAWDVDARKSMFEPTSLYPLLSRSNSELLTRAENLTLCGISSSGVPVVTISNGNGYLYDSDMDTWTLISDSWWAFGSQYWDSRDRKTDSSIVSMVEKKTNDEIVRRGRGKFLQKMAKTMLMKEGYENLEKTISLAHLENRILTSLKLKDDVEFKTHLIIYCKRVSEMGFKAKLLEIFEELMGPPDSLDSSDRLETPDSSWNPKILSFDKHELLKELIFACARFRVVQRILVQFATALDILDSVSLY